MSIQAIAPGGGAGASGALANTAEQERVLQKLRDQLDIEKQHIALLQQADPLERQETLTMSVKGRVIEEQAALYKLLEAAHTTQNTALGQQLAATNHDLMTQKDLEKDLLEASKLLIGIADPFQKLSVQLQQVAFYEKEGALTASDAAKLRISYADQVDKAERTNLQTLVDTNAQLHLQAQQAVTPSGGGSSQQLAEMQRLITLQKEAAFLAANPVATDAYRELNLALIDATQAQSNYNDGQKHAIDLFNQSLSPMQIYKRRLDDINASAAAFPGTLDTAAVKRLSDQALESAAGITPAYKEMRDASFRRATP